MTRLTFCAFNTALILIVIGLTSCISANPKEQLDQTAALATNRTGSSVALQDAWSQPYTDREGPWDGASTLDLDTALHVALRNDPDLRRQLTLVAEHKADLSQTSMPPNPLVNFRVGIPLDGMGGAPALVQVMQQITWLWTMSDRIDRDQEQLQATILNVASTTMGRTAQVRAAFMNLLWAQEVLALREQFVVLTTKTTNLIITLADVGEEPHIEVLRGQLEHCLATEELFDAQHEVITKKIALLRLMGWPEHNLDWAAEGDLNAATRQDPGSEENVLDRAEIVRLDIAAAERQIESMRAAARLAGLSQLPTVDFYTTWRRNFSGRTAIEPGAVISIPIFDNGSAKIAKAAAQLEAAYLDAAIVRENAIQETREALNEWKRAQGQVFLYQGGRVHLARTLFERSNTTFQAGLTDSTELLRTQQNVIKAEVELLSEQLQASLAWIDLEKAVGGSFDLPLIRPTLESEDHS